MSSEDDVQCDSLSAATLGAPALSVPPSLRPPSEKRAAKFAPWLVAGALLGAGGFGAARPSVPDLALPEALHVDGRTVSYSAAFAAHAGIRTMEVRELPFSPVVSATGKASFDPEQVAAIGAHALGTVRRVAKYEGDRVKRGEVLAEIGSPSQAGREPRAHCVHENFPRGRWAYRCCALRSMARSSSAGSAPVSRCAANASYSWSPISIDCRSV
ncbi:MAG: hypothetical protein WDO74_03335 [Pseudomonadota bacterium]